MGKRQRKRSLPGQFLVGDAERELFDFEYFVDFSDHGHLVLLHERDERDGQLRMGDKRP